MGEDTKRDIARRRAVAKIERAYFTALLEDCGKDVEQLLQRALDQLEQGQPNLIVAAPSQAPR